MEEQIVLSPLSSREVNEINECINTLNKKYFIKRIWPFNSSDLMLNGSALISGEMQVSHFKAIWERSLDDAFSSNPKNTWHEIKEKEKIEFSFKISKISKFLSKKFVADIEVMFTEKDDKIGYKGVYLGSTAGKKISDIFNNINEVIEHKKNPKYCSNTLEALKKYT